MRENQRGVATTATAKRMIRGLTPFRSFHSTPVIRDDNDPQQGSGDGGDAAPMSEKDRKKMLKEKAKAMQAEKEAKAAEAAAADGSGKAMSVEERKKMLQEKAKAKQATETPSSEDNKTETTTTDESATGSVDAPPSPPPPAATEATTSESSPPPPPSNGGPPIVDGVRQYSTPEITADAAKHRAGLKDPDIPCFQNPLHHNNPEMQKIFREDFESDEAFEKAVQPAPPLDDGSGRVPAPQHIHDLAEEMLSLTMLEYNELINRLADHYGFDESWLAPSADGTGGGGADEDDEEGDAAPAQEKTTFDVRLVSFDEKAKIKIIKEARAVVPGLGLKEAKALVESAPCLIQKGLKKEDAEAIKEKLDALGAVTEVV
jgi:large subunit ribosomal protein L7/L12